MTKQDREEFKEFHKKLDSVVECVQSISFAINSDVKQKRVGIAEQTIINTKDISTLKTESKVRIGKIGVIVSFASLILGVIGGVVGRYFFK